MDITAEKLAQLEKLGRVEVLKDVILVFVGELPTDQIEALKKEYNNRVFALEVKGELIEPNVQEVLVGYFKKPNRIAIARAMGYVNVNQTIEAGESILDDTWLAGDERLKSIKEEHTEYRVAVAHELYLKTSIAEVKVKNL